MSTNSADATSVITEHEAAQVAAANDSGRTPVMFVHGLWLLPSSWDRWAELFQAAGYAPLTPGWPDDPETPAQANAHPEVLAGKSIGQVADHFAAIGGALDRKPVLSGHSFGRHGFEELRSREAGKGGRVITKHVEVVGIVGGAGILSFGSDAFYFAQQRSQVFGILRALL